MQIGNWSTDAGGLDVLQHIPGVDGRQLGYPELRQHATRVTDDERVFAVASLADITTSKRAAGRQKDLEALSELERFSPRIRHPETMVASTSDCQEFRIVAGGAA